MQITYKDKKSTKNLASFLGLLILVKSLWKEKQITTMIAAIKGHYSTHCNHALKYVYGASCDIRNFVCREGKWQNKDHLQVSSVQ